MKKYFILLMIFTTSISYSQRCGGGTFIFEFYTLNGEKQENLYYEILNFDSNSLKTHNTNNKTNQATYASFVRDYENGIIINSNMVNEIDQENEDLIKSLTKRKVDKKGVIDNGVMKFKTIETYNKLF